MRCYHSDEHGVPTHVVSGVCWGDSVCRHSWLSTLSSEARLMSKTDKDPGVISSGSLLHGLNFFLYEKVEKFFEKLLGGSCLSITVP